MNSFRLPYDEYSEEDKAPERDVNGVRDSDKATLDRVERVSDVDEAHGRDDDVDCGIRACHQPEEDKTYEAVPT